MLTFILGYFLGVGSLAATFDILRAFRGAQEREQAFQQRAKGLGGDHDV